MFLTAKINKSQKTFFLFSILLVLFSVLTTVTANDNKQREEENRRRGIEDVEQNEIDTSEDFNNNFLRRNSHNRGLRTSPNVTSRLVKRPNAQAGVPVHRRRSRRGPTAEAREGPTAAGGPRKGPGVPGRSPEGLRRPRRMSTRHLLASHRSGNFCPYSVTKVVTCLVANGTETYQTRVAVGTGFQTMTMKRPRLVTSYKEVKETNYGCCPGFYGDNCDTMCFNCTKIQDLESRVRTLESKLLRNPSHGTRYYRSGNASASSASATDTDEDGSESFIDNSIFGSAKPPIKMGRPDVSHVNGHPLNGGGGRRRTSAAGGSPGYLGGSRPGYHRGGGGPRQNGGHRAGYGGRRRLAASQGGGSSADQGGTPGRPRPNGPGRCNCPPGKPGPPGPPGPPADPVSDRPGNDGSRDDSLTRYIPGPPGKPGQPGLSGPVGLAGSPGLPGVSGRDGLPGLRGAPGIGLPGSPGKDGIPGSPGSPGVPIPGIPGAHGPKGAPGLPGLSGSAGPSGLPGPIGPVGPRGHSGDTGPPGRPAVSSGGGNRRSGLEAYDLTSDIGTGTARHGPSGPKGDRGEPGVIEISGLSSSGDSNAAAALDNLYRAVGALRQNLDYLDSRVTLLETQLPRLRGTIGGRSDYPEIPPTTLFSETNEFSAVTEDLNNRLDSINNAIDQTTPYYPPPLTLPTEPPLVPGHVSYDEYTRTNQDRGSDHNNIDHDVTRVGQDRGHHDTREDPSGGTRGHGGPWDREGARGTEGGRGEEGARGRGGSRGQEGARGLEGTRGPEGTRGQEGSRGPEGTRGPVGGRGPEGASGREGGGGRGGAGIQDGSRHPDGPRGYPDDPRNQVVDYGHRGFDDQYGSGDGTTDINDGDGSGGGHIIDLDTERERAFDSHNGNVAGRDENHNLQTGIDTNRRPSTWDPHGQGRRPDLNTHYGGGSYGSSSTSSSSTHGSTDDNLNSGSQLTTDNKDENLIYDRQTGTYRRVQSSNTHQTDGRLDQTNNRQPGPHDGRLNPNQGKFDPGFDSELEYDEEELGSGHGSDQEGDTFGRNDFDEASRGVGGGNIGPQQGGGVYNSRIGGTNTLPPRNDGFGNNGTLDYSQYEYYYEEDNKLDYEDGETYEYDYDDYPADSNNRRKRQQINQGNIREKHQNLRENIKTGFATQNSASSLTQNDGPLPQNRVSNSVVDVTSTPAPSDVETPSNNIKDVSGEISSNNVVEKDDRRVSSATSNNHQKFTYKLNVSPPLSSGSTDQSRNNVDQNRSNNDEIKNNNVLNRGTNKQNRIGLAQTVTTNDNNIASVVNGPVNRGQRTRTRRPNHRNRPASSRPIRPGPALKPNTSATNSSNMYHRRIRNHHNSKSVNLRSSNITNTGSASGRRAGYPQLQTLRRLAKKWKTRKHQLARHRQERDLHDQEEEEEELTWI